MYRSEFQQRIAVNILNDIFRQEDGNIFVGRDGDIFIIYLGTKKDLLNKAIFQLRYLFVDDPLANHEDGTENENFCTMYDVNFQWRPLYRVCSERMSLAAQLDAQAEVAANLAQKGMLTPSRLSKIIEELETVDFSFAMRRQPICAFQKHKQPRAVYHEMYVNMAHLRKLLPTDCNLTSEKWLFHYFTQILDEHVIDLLVERPKHYLSEPVSLNLNVSTVLSKQFSDFLKRVGQSMKPTIVVEIDVADMFSNMHTFLEARDLLHKMGHRLCIDGLTNESFIQVERKALGFDLAKLQWNADLVGDLESPENKMLVRSIQECGSNRMILCRCDDQHAIEYGHALGISLFQGRYADRVLNPDSMVIN